MLFAHAIWSWIHKTFLKIKYFYFLFASIYDTYIQDSFFLETGQEKQWKLIYLKNIFLRKKMFLRKHLRRYLIIFNLKSFRLMIITLICRLCKNMDFEVIFIQSLAKTPYTTPKLVMLRQFLRILKKKNDLSNILTNILE